MFNDVQRWFNDNFSSFTVDRNSRLPETSIQKLIKIHFPWLVHFVNLINKFKHNAFRYIPTQASPVSMHMAF